MRSILWLWLLLSTGPVWGAGLTLEGPATQGGLLVGRIEPGGQVSLEGRTLRVSPQGVFLLGFGRDAPQKMVLEASYPNGRREQRVLYITPRQYDIQRIDGLPPSKVTPMGEETLARIRREAAMVARVRERDDPRQDFLSGFDWPAQGRISGVYGSQRILNGQPRQPHYGIDIAAPRGTPVTAPADGVVTMVAPDLYYSGGTLILDHGHGLSSAFLHLDRITVAEGQKVRRGEKIAEVGATGRATGPHLDWRVNWFEERIDPQLLLGPLGR
ncbi:MAG: M23 family metallopeptidase [Candidatus Competibacteraceae bacterium]|nr:M23 family metallopeptidase [Candidatus Competibacteraceae bacterium]